LQKLEQEIEMEPILRVQLLRFVLEAGCGGSHPMKLAFARQQELLVGTSFDENANWVNPVDPAAPRARSPASILLRQIGFRTMDDPIVDHSPLSLEQTKKRITESLKAMNKPGIGSEYEWIGWLVKDESRWTVRLPHRFRQAAGKLLVVGKAAVGSPVFTEIGRIDNYEPRVESLDANALRVGRPVYRIVAAGAPLPR
jgi:hypothetical protein